MKIVEWIKIFKMTNQKSDKKKSFSLTLNNADVEKVNVLVNPLSSDTYKLLRKFATPQYDLMFLMRNKKGFNTLFFQQRYDVIVCDKNFKIISLFPELKMGFISENFANGYFIYFSTVGTINFLDLKENDRLRIKRDFI